MHLTSLLRCTAHPLRDQVHQFTVRQELLRAEELIEELQNRARNMSIGLFMMHTPFSVENVRVDGAHNSRTCYCYFGSSVNQ